MYQHTAHNEDDTRRIAVEFATTLKGGDVVELIGDLGAGKTAFVRAAAEVLGVMTRVKSPTFTVMNEYPAEGPRGITRIAHLDLYRFKTPSELGALELEEYIRPDTVVFVEWPNVFDIPIFKSAKRVEIMLLDGDARKITITE